MKRKEARSLAVHSTLLNIKRSRVLYLMLAPALIYFVVFKLQAILGMDLAFYDYRIVGPHEFVGLKHFKELFSTPAFWQIMKNTLVISFTKLIIITPFPVMFAIMLSQMKSGKLKKITQVVSYLPHFLSWVVIAGIWFEFLAMNGVVMDLWDAMGGTRTNLLTNKDTIIGVLVASEMWRSVGWDSIIYLSAILAISPDLYEAARLDGANRWQIIRNIILPALIAPIITVLIVNVGVVLNVGYDQILNFQNDAVLSRVDVIDTYAYRIGLQGTQYSFATAASLFKSVISLGLILITHFTAKKLTGKGAW